jgi:hypothetical protein
VRTHYDNLSATAVRARNPHHAAFTMLILYRALPNDMARCFAHRVVAQMAGFVPLFRNTASRDDSDEMVQEDHLFTKNGS